MNKIRTLSSISGFPPDYALKWNHIARIQSSSYSSMLPGTMAPFNDTKVVSWNTFVSGTQRQHLSSLDFSCCFIEILVHNEHILPIFHSFYFKCKITLSLGGSSELQYVTASRLMVLHEFERPVI